jgi:transposase
MMKSRTRTRAPGFELDSKVVGAFPLVNHFLKRLRIEEFLQKRLPPQDPRALLPTQNVLGFLLRNLVLARAPLYKLGEWAREAVPALMGLEPEQLRLLNDDRVGRALERLFDADRQTLLTELVVSMVREFEVDLEEFHNDSTSITLQGKYKDATGKRVRGKPSLRAALGHNKDHRPDLKQLLWILTISADGSVPVHFKVTDGNTADSTTHVETWNALRQLVGSSAFLYVADSKLCTRGNLRHIHGQGGLFITMLPRTWKEDALFKDWIQHNTPNWDEVARKPHPRLRNGPPDIFCAAPSPNPDADGFRITWYKSSHKLERDAEARGNALHTATQALNQLRAKLEGPRPRWRSQAAVAEAVERILEKSGAGRWLDYAVVAFEKPTYYQEKRGRPGAKTRWRRRIKTRFQLTWTLRQEQIDYDARCDGLFPLITNTALSPQQILESYKSKQPLVERQHHLLKAVQSGVPVFLHSNSRIEALFFLHFVALVVNALLERQVRQAMATRGINTLPLYAEERECRAPSAERILETFGSLQRHLLRKGGTVTQHFDPELTPLHRTILRLAGLSKKTFANW